LLNVLTRFNNLSGFISNELVDRPPSHILPANNGDARASDRSPLKFSFVEVLKIGRSRFGFFNLPRWSPFVNDVTEIMSPGTTTG